MYICIFLIMPRGQESFLIQPANQIYDIHLQSPQGILFYISFYHVEYLHAVCLHTVED